VVRRFETHHENTALFFLLDAPSSPSNSFPPGNPFLPTFHTIFPKLAVPGCGLALQNHLHISRNLPKSPFHPHPFLPPPPFSCSQSSSHSPRPFSPEFAIASFTMVFPFSNCNTAPTTYPFPPPPLFFDLFLPFR